MAKQNKYKLVVSLGGVEIKSTGDTAFEAVSKLEKPVKITTKGTVTMTYGKQKAEVLYTIPRLKRMFYPIARTVVAKNLTALLK